jgi:hypothetical protein
MTSLLAKRPDVPVVTFPDGIGFHSTHPLLVNVPRPTREPDRPVSTRVSVHPPEEPCPSCEYSIRLGFVAHGDKLSVASELAHINPLRTDYWNAIPNICR